jgi:hypothetical protein
MMRTLRAGARALRDFLRGFVGIAPRRPLAHTHDDGRQRPFCC